MPHEFKLRNSQAADLRNHLMQHFFCLRYDNTYGATSLQVSAGTSVSGSLSADLELGSLIEPSKVTNSLIVLKCR
jgi:hypothetical protein